MQPKELQRRSENIAIRSAAHGPTACEVRRKSVVRKVGCASQFVSRSILYEYYKLFFLPAPSILDLAHVAPTDLFLHLNQKCLDCLCTVETWLFNNSSTRLTMFCSLSHADTSKCSLLWRNVRENSVFLGNMNTYTRVFYQNSNTFCGIETNASYVHFTTCFTVLQDLWTRYVRLFPCTPEGYCIFAACSLLHVPVTSTNTSFKLLTITKGVYISRHNIIFSKNTATCFDWMWLVIIRPNYKNTKGYYFLPFFSVLVIRYDDG